MLLPSTLSPSSSSFPERDSTRVLVPGCGNSLVMEHMLDDGYKHITNVDFSPVVITQMEERYKNRGMIFKVADVTKPLPFPNSSFDLILCKGTLDAILCCEGASISAREFTEECCRVLDENHGVLVVITYGNREERMMYFEDENVWPGGVEVKEVPKPRVNSPNVENENDRKSNHYVYICRKGKKEGSSEGKSNTNDELETIHEADENATESRAKL